MKQVEEEKRGLPRKHRKKRLHALYHKRIPGKTYTDIVYSNVQLARGYQCFQIYYIRRSGKVCTYMMQWESQAPNSMEDFLVDNRSPLILQSDNIRVMTSKIMKKILCREKIEQVVDEVILAKTPTVPNNHPEEDNSTLLNKLGIYHYQMIVGCLNWIV